MKQIRLFTAAIAAILALATLASCQKEQNPGAPATEGVTSFTATILQTKTTIATDGKIAWGAGDEIAVTDASAATSVFVAESAGASTTFNIKDGETPLGDGPYTATYGSIDSQLYDASGANCPLVAEATTGTSFTFSSPYAVMRITAKSESAEAITKVEVENDGTLLATLTCSGQVLTPEGTVFYVALEADTYAALKVTFYTDVFCASKVRSSELTLAAGDLLPLTLSFISDDWEPSCVAAGTMITMADGSRKPVEQLVEGDVIRTFDHENGVLSTAPICFVWETKNIAKAFTLSFVGETGEGAGFGSGSAVGEGPARTEVTVIEEHGFYCREQQRYAFINARNAKDYIGCHFYDADAGCWLELTGCKQLNRGVDAYSIVTRGHLNHLADGLLSMSDGSFTIMANIFDFDDQLRYDAARMAADIAEYGLTPLEKVLEYEGFTEADYTDYNLQYLNVAVGKGITTWDYVQALSDYCVANGIY